VVKGKAFETGGEISKILKMLHVNFFHIPLTICKRIMKRFSKRICKNKTMVHVWSKMLNKRKQSMHM
jgi:hypothetical protein